MASASRIPLAPVAGVGPPFGCDECRIPRATRHLISCSGSNESILRAAGVTMSDFIRGGGLPPDPPHATAPPAPSTSPFFASCASPAPAQAFPLTIGCDECRIPLGTRHYSWCSSSNQSILRAAGVPEHDIIRRSGLPLILPRFLPLPVPLPTATGTLRGVLLPGRVTFGGRLSEYFNQGILTRLMCVPLFRGVGQTISTFGRLPGFGPKVYHYD